MEIYYLTSVLCWKNDKARSKTGHATAQLIETLRYKPTGGGFDFALT